jgi:hypothetical protein
MLPLKYDQDYNGRRKIAQGTLIDIPDLGKGTPLQIRDRTGLTELSFAFFVGWLFTGILIRSKELVRASFLPVGKSRESSILVLYYPETVLAPPSRRQTGLLDETYFRCPLDQVLDRALTQSEMVTVQPTGRSEGARRPWRWATKASCK